METPNNRQTNTKTIKADNRSNKLHRHAVLNSMLIKIHIGIIGPPKCGKTSLLKSFIYKTFNPTMNEDTILNIHKLVITIDFKPIELIITEIAINKEDTNEKIARELTKSMDVIFLCHEMKEKDTDFNEEDIKKMIAYINNITNKKKIILYLVGCKLDQKFQSLGNDTANIYEKSAPYKLTTYGQRIKTFVDGNKIKKFFATSALLNFNIAELFEHAIMSATYLYYKSIHEKKIRKDSLAREGANKNILNEVGDQNDELMNEEEFMERCSIF